MATIRRFEEIHAWQKARELTRDVYRALAQCRDRGFTDQIQRAAVSVMSNVAEGFERGTRQEFLNYLYIAKGSAGEVRAQLYVAYDVGYLNIEMFKDLKARAEEVSKLLSSFIRGVKVSPHEGLQRKHEQTSEERSRTEFEQYVQNELAKIHPHIYGKKGDGNQI